MDDLDRRFHGRLVGSPPCESLSAGQTSSACRSRSDRDIPPNAELEDGEIPQHSRDLEDGVNSPCEQPWQRDLRLRQHDDWCSDDDEQISVSGAARNVNRKPRFYRDGEIPYSHLEVVSSRQPHREPEVANSEDFSTKITLQGRSTGDMQPDLEGESEPELSTTGIGHHGGKRIEHDQVLSHTRIKNSTTVAPELGAGKDGNPSISTIVAR